MDEKLYRNLDILEAYIGTPEKFQWYEKAFDKYDVNGIEKIAWNWSWYAFFSTPIYLLYRKCYIAGIIFWILQFFTNIYYGFTGVILSIILAGIAPMLVFKRYKRVVKQIQEVESNPNLRIEMVRDLGGVNKTARNLGIIFQITLLSSLLLSLILYFGTMASIINYY
ncbi:MAG: DUF2628 domain-containing protein [Fusobacterium perfoetens]|uniref:DUF2628 domain-containing protein n=1 Tax=Fusobacterium perfoetens TaxID=852 RepID=UPI0023F16EC9|nr:DUF2628 domain-containing protein [Fusobacterium perfoetens]MCI6152309.1 DUF2628 domain-containing protein [Fusobacterium perfoetens]MDY3238167.1 DUF2628 domain-containing protein [Fusobacterium perfoetens]